MTWQKTIPKPIEGNTFKKNTTQASRDPRSIVSFVSRYIQSVFLIHRFIDKQMKEGKEAMKPPEPHMCVQTAIIVSTAWYPGADPGFFTGGDPGPYRKAPTL